MIKKYLNGDKVIFFLPIIISIFGLITVFNASSSFAQINFDDSYHFFRLQIIWLVIALLGQIIFSVINLNLFKKISPYLLFISVVFLILVLFPGIGRIVNGGRRWISLGSVVFQPAELAKIALLFYFCSYFEKKNRILHFLFITVLILGLIMMEPDLGTACVIIGTLFCLFFISGAPVKPFLYSILFFIFLVVILIISSPYRRDRLNSFLNLSSNIENSSYHMKQILISLGSGGFWGKGFGQSLQKNLFLPEASTDSIFAVIAEEFGFLGTACLMLAFLFLIYRGFTVSLNCDDKYKRLLSVSFVLLITFQVLINLGAMVSLFPLTGIPLPFISYGGSSLLVFHSSVGIIYNVSRGKAN